MVLDIETAGALVPGSSIKRKEDNVEMQKVKILRSFRDGKTDLPKDAIMVIPKWLALQAKEANKVEFIVEAKPPEEKAAKAESPKETSVHPEDPKPETKGELKAELKGKPKNI